MKQKFTKMMAFVVVAVLSLGLVASASFPDVPADHWAYDAVTRLVDEGLLSGMPDGTFSGSEPMNRYSVAVLIARLLDRIEAQPASVIERVVQQPVTVNQPVQPIIEKTIERVIQEPVEVTKIIEKEYIEKPVIEKHIVHEFAGLTEDQVTALIDAKAEDILFEVEGIMSDTEARVYQFMANRFKTIIAQLKTVEEASALTESKLAVLSTELEASMDEKIAAVDSTKSINELKDQLEAQNDKIITMEGQLKTTRTIAILGLLAGIAGIVVGIVM
ncbi:MAG: S-layer homology domain-containing protein [Bacillota bacterium]|jgi:hypothetical protein|nr:S-layer homology domain-containing protein [Bacillota bacterium]NLU55656.1 S-layer homology domain-containing protein [Bacillota bacterium]HOA90279.1 S-layer homology domain-containing protein [Bacillota bacterium]HPQ10785.1 S-layer homology domain-containing protein [Bacillota bacterium]HPT60016.1 S-layer homology domain-containing protein [Bacillota bacterium]